MKKCVIALTLLLCLTLSACGGETKDEQGQQSFLGKAVGLAEDAVLLKVDGREIAAWQYLYWLNRGWEDVCRQYRSADAGVDWETSVEGGTLAGYVKQQALENTVLYATVENWAEKYGCTLTEAEKQEVSADWDTQAASRGGEAIYLAELAKQGLDRVRAEALAAVSVQYGKLRDFCRKEDSPLLPDDAALADYADTVGVLTVDRILIAAGADREGARQRAAEVFSALNNAPDQAAAFDALAKEGDDPLGARTVTRGDGTLPAALEEAAAMLEVGQFSGILESEEGFSILKRLPPARDALLDGYFDALLLSAAAEAFVTQTQEYAELDVVDFDIGRRALEIVP
ncbi:MAG: hypothetical protein E7443_03350 [Ruminococcaceae bacterium]|nr:hypothetical protein [Oscillospiraceae bacterium]